MKEPLHVNAMALFRAPGMGAIYRVKVPNHEGSSSG
jgi:hypothetical protein